MQTPYGEISEDDIVVLEYRLHWYLWYGNQPTCKLRETTVAKNDYGIQYERYVGHLFDGKGFRDALSNGFYYPPYHRDILKRIYALRKNGTNKSIS